VRYDPFQGRDDRLFGARSQKIGEITAVRTVDASLWRAAIQFAQIDHRATAAQCPLAPEHLRALSSLSRGGRTAEEPLVRPKTPPAHKETSGSAKKHLDALLDEALTETFPASDPIAVDPIQGGKVEELHIAGLEPSALAEAILSTRADAIVLADSQGIIRFWNPGAERIFGFSRTEAVGQSLDIIIPERLRKRHWDGFDRSMKAGQTRYGDGDVLAVPAIRKDGSQISVEFTIVMLRNNGGDVLGIAAILRDVTTRFEEMRALRRQLNARPS
jgi:PAS domain S-box-containing protein